MPRIGIRSLPVRNTAHTSNNVAEITSRLQSISLGATDIYIYTTFYYFWVLFNQSIFPQILQVKLSPHHKGLPKKNLGLLMQDFLQARYLSSETTNSVVSCRDINIQCVHEEGRDITLPQSCRLYRNMKINESQMFCD